MIDFFEGVINFFKLLGSYISGIVLNSIMAVKSIVDSVNLVALLSGYMPAMFAGVILAASALLVVKFIFGR